MTAFEVVRLTGLMEITQGSPALSIGLIDGPVSVDSSGDQPSSFAAKHGSLIASMLTGAKGGVPAICPECPLLVRSIFSGTPMNDPALPSAEPGALAGAMMECIRAGARVINLSLTLAQASAKAERNLDAVLDQAVRRRVIVVAAAGNQNMAGSSVITRHPWVVPVMACDLQGRPTTYSNFGRSIGTRGLSAPGEGGVRPTGAGGAADLRGTSIATPYVTGAIALLWSMFPEASAQQVKGAVTQAAFRRASLVSPLLDAWAAYQTLLTAGARRLM